MKKFSFIIIFLISLFSTNIYADSGLDLNSVDDSDPNSSLVNDYKNFEFFSEDNIKKDQKITDNNHEKLNYYQNEIFNNNKMRELNNYSNVSKIAFNGVSHHYLGNDKTDKDNKKYYYFSFLFIALSGLLAFIYYSRKRSRRNDNSKLSYKKSYY